MICWASGDYELLCGRKAKKNDGQWHLEKMMVLALCKWANWCLADRWTLSPLIWSPSFSSPWSPSLIRLLPYPSFRFHCSSSLSTAEHHPCQLCPRAHSFPAVPLAPFQFFACRADARMKSDAERRIDGTHQVEMMERGGGGEEEMGQIGSGRRMRRRKVGTSGGKVGSEGKEEGIRKRIRKSRLLWSNWPV